MCRCDALFGRKEDDFGRVVSEVFMDETTEHGV